MDKSLRLRVALLLVVFVGPSCGAITGRLDSEQPPVYSGTVGYVSAVADGSWMEGDPAVPNWLETTAMVLAVFDFPLTIVLDTALLPIDLALWPFGGWRSMHKSKSGQNR